MMFNYSKSMKAMKTKYSTPEMKVRVFSMDLMISKESNPNDDEILGKGRWDNEDDVKKETDSWTDGLW